MLQTFSVENWQEAINPQVSNQALTTLEQGQVIHLPNLAFEFLGEERKLLSTHYASPKTKNISYDLRSGKLQGAICAENETTALSQLMQRYAENTRSLVVNLFPAYQSHLLQGRTSYRPIEIAGRKPPSYRKDDTRLHVDAFPSTPLGDKRILRVFTNVNPHNQSRVWRLGAPFPTVVEHFHSKLKKPVWGTSFLLHLLKVTKSKRTLYDHYMLQLHNAMKADLTYQKQVQQMEFHFPAGSTWIVYTDQVSHAAMSGQFTLEQTFYIPLKALNEPKQAPSWVLDNYLKGE
jgi:hypothetical protein